MATSTKPRTLSLADYTDEMLALDALVDLDEGEWSEVHDELANELLAALAEKVDAFVEYRSTLRTQRDTAEEYARAILAKSKRLQRQIDWLDSYALAQLERSGREKVQGQVFTMRRQATMAVALDCLPTQLPADFQRVIPEVVEADKKALAAALKAGAQIDGVRLVTNYHLRTT